MVDQPNSIPARDVSADDYKEMLRKMLDAFNAMQGENTLLGELFKSILATFLGISREDLDNPQDAPDFEDVTDPAQRAQLERDYSTNREANERRAAGGNFSASIGSWTADSMATSSAKLVALRTKWEGLRGGHVEAESPVNGGRINSEFGHREAGATGGVGSTEHKGLDIGPPQRGQSVPIKAPMPGVIVGKGWRGGYGNMIEMVDIYGVHHRFGHLASADVQIGQTVEPGQQIAMMGTTGHSTGVHLHYEQRDADGTARAPELDGKSAWSKGQILMAGAVAPRAQPDVPALQVAAAAASEPAHPAHTAARAAVKPLKTQLAAVVSHPPHKEPEHGVLAMARDAGHKALAFVGLA